MGMFDSVMVRCDCGGHAEFQTKAHDCILRQWNPEDAPPEVLRDLDGRVEFCDKCNAPWRFTTAAEWRVFGKAEKG